MRNCNFLFVSRVLLSALAFAVLCFSLLATARLEARQAHHRPVSHAPKTVNDTWLPFRMQQPACNITKHFDSVCTNDLITWSETKSCSGLSVQFYKDDACSQRVNRPKAVRQFITSAIGSSFGSFMVLKNPNKLNLVFSRAMDVPCLAANGEAIDTRRSGLCVVSPFEPRSATVATAIPSKDFVIQDSWDHSNSPFHRNVKGAPKTSPIRIVMGAKVELYEKANCTGDKGQFNVLLGINPVCTAVSPRFEHFQGVKVVSVSQRPGGDGPERNVNTLLFSPGSRDQAPDPLTGTYGCGMPAFVTGLADKNKKPVINRCFNRTGATIILDDSSRPPQSIVNVPIHGLSLDAQDPQIDLPF